MAGWDADFSDDSHATVARQRLEADIASILRPSIVNKYAIIVGPGGTGKSTAVRKVVHALIAEGAGGAGAGVAHFSTRELLADFSQDLARAVGYRTPINFLDRMRRYITGEIKEQAAPPLQRYEPRASWSPLSRLLMSAAKLHKARHGRAPTLVLDAMDVIAKKDAAFFGEVQEFAKACADGGILRVVFIFSDGDALPPLLSSSAESRCDKDQIYEVGDISDNDAIKFVASRYGKSEALARELVETITGGRFTLLQSYGKTAKPLAAIRQVLDIETNLRLKAAGVRPTHPLFKALSLAAASAGIHNDAAAEMLELSKISALLRLNILAVHPDGTYTFNSRRVEARIREALEYEQQQREAEEAAAQARRRWW